MHHNGDVVGRQYPQNGDFGSLLRDSGLSKRDLAMLVKVHPNTVSRWAGGAEVPGAVMAYLRLRVRVRELLG